MAHSVGLGLEDVVFCVGRGPVRCRGCGTCWHTPVAIAVRVYLTVQNISPEDKSLGEIVRLVLKKKDQLRTQHIGAELLLDLKKGF